MLRLFDAAPPSPTLERHNLARAGILFPYTFRPKLIHPLTHCATTSYTTTPSSLSSPPPSHNSSAAHPSMSDAGAPTYANSAAAALAQNGIAATTTMQSQQPWRGNPSGPVQVQTAYEPKLDFGNTRTQRDHDAQGRHTGMPDSAHAAIKAVTVQ